MIQNLKYGKFVDFLKLSRIRFSEIDKVYMDEPLIRCALKFYHWVTLADCFNYWSIHLDLDLMIYVGVEVGSRLKANFSLNS